MQTKPGIGDHVSFPGNPAIGACTGRVEHIYDTFDPARPWTDVPFDAALTGVRLRVENIPDPWPYGDSRVFMPRISEIKPLAMTMFPAAAEAKRGTA